VHIITRKRLNEFAKKHPGERSSLVRWYKLMRTSDIDSFSELKELFPNADKVGKLTIFNIGGNNIRLIAAIHYNRRSIFAQF
jgi:mRNA interferase HigB